MQAARSTLRTIYKMSTGKNFETASLHDQHKVSVIDTTMIVALEFYHRGRGRESWEALASPIAATDSPYDSDFRGDSYAFML